ncbi:MAG TPA: dihydropteroate synthase [Pseudolabrys sp.]|nr:dihydropteroate synthase [Pseudolabrys sp.]
MTPQRRAQRDALLAQIGSGPVLMGILNVTPDSFSDGGRFSATDAALAHARQMTADGAAIVDIGAESTRPGATPVSEAEELARLEPVLAVLADALAVPISVDTTKAAVARRAAALGAVMINDVWGLQQDPAMADAVAEAETALVISHNRTTLDDAIDIVADMQRFFDHSLKLARRAGIPPGRLILDPGIGFAKSSRQNRAALTHLDTIRTYGLPILVGVSRKRFLGSLTGDGVEATPVGTVAAAIAAVADGAAIIRAHDVAAHAAAFRVWQALIGG